MKNWILAFRPKTMPAAMVPVWVGSAPALFEEGGGFSWLLFWCTLASALCIQVATNLFNDAIDSVKGADTDNRKGPKRATASGLLSRKSVMIGGLVFCALAAGFSVPLIMERGWIIILIGVVSLALAYGYTGGPLPLAYNGLGELFVIVFFGYVSVLGSYFVQKGDIAWELVWVAALQVGLYSCVLIAVNNLRDIDEDRQANKRTLAVRFGAGVAKFEIAAFCLVPIFLWFLYGPSNWITVGALAMSFLLASVIIFKVYVDRQGKSLNAMLGVGALQLINFAVWWTVWLAQKQSAAAEMHPSVH